MLLCVGDVGELCAVRYKLPDETRVRIDGSARLAIAFVVLSLANAARFNNPARFGLEKAEESVDWCLARPGEFVEGSGRAKAGFCSVEVASACDSNEEGNTDAEDVVVEGRDVRWSADILGSREWETAIKKQEGRTSVLRNRYKNSRSFLGPGS